MSSVLKSKRLDPAFDEAGEEAATLARAWGPRRRDPAALLRDVEQRVLALAESGRESLLLAVPVRPLTAEDFLDLARSRDAFLWHTPGGAAYAGQGCARSLRADGPGRLQALRRSSEAILRELRTVALDGAAMDPPRLWGGMAFAAGAADQEPWTSFGDAEFFLPRFLYRLAGGSEPAASLALVISAEEAADTESRQGLLGEYQRLLEAIEQGAPAAPGRLGSIDACDSYTTAEAEAGDSAWIEQVEAIRRAIVEAKVEKIVAARRFRMDLSPNLRISTVLRRLGQGLRSSTRFAFRRGSGADGATFLGATPERLIAKRGLDIETEALAGTMEAGGRHAAQLLASDKNLHEHRLVTEAIVRRLEPLCEALRVPQEPTVRELREILHLHTPIRGRLTSDRHVLELVEALHPTPAVGGVPTATALDWIERHEHHARGWYAAPIGWFDGEGDGEFHVALRSCVLAGGRAYLYAGAGIVADSDPHAELEETRLKIQLLRRALANESP